MKIDKIEQQIYTRARQTLFQQSEGYGTVAKSDGLGEAFIKEQVHPYCMYPTKLQNYKMHPKVVTLVHYPCGRMLFGQAVYKEKDFTGQRATFFAHNYIFPPQMVDKVLRNFGMLRHMEFLTEYDVAQGKLNALESANLARHCEELSTADEAAAFATKQSKKFQLNNILQCIAASISGTKKTYIIAPPSQIHDFAWDFLINLYTRLSEETRHQLGFCTYAREPVNKKGIHLIFIEKSDSRFANDFVIDLRNPVVAVSPMTTKAERVANFFQESEFWHIRTPHRREVLLRQGCEWLETNLEKLTLLQLASVPGSFIIRGKGFCQPELYVMLGILKTCAGAISTHTPFDLRYLLGSYNLSPQNHFRVVQNLRRLYQKHINSVNYENIVFLFRAHGKGRLDTTGLETYLRKFADSEKAIGRREDDNNKHNI